MHRIKNLNKKWVAATLAVAVLILLNLIGGRLPGQLDLTDASLFTLSPASRELVANLPEPIELRYYFSRSSDALPIQFKNFGTRIEDLLRQYQRAANGRIDLRIIDPRPDTDDEQAALRAGLRAQPLPNGDQLFFGLQVTFADSSAVIPVFSMNREAFLEYDISQLIFTVQQLEKPRLGLLTSLELEPRNDPLPGMGRQPPMGPAFIEELRKSYQLSILQEENIPDDLDVLLVIHPQDLSDAQLFAIDQFVLSGRPAIIAVDPSAYTQRATQNPQMMMGGLPSAASNLQRLFNAWGIEFAPNEVVADLELATPVSVQAGGPAVRYPVWLSLRNPQSDSPLLANLSELLFVESGHFRMSDSSPADREWTSLIETTGNGGTVPANTLAFTPPEQLSRKLVNDGQRHTIAGILRAILPTAFPDGKPSEPTTGDAEDTEAASAADTPTETPAEPSLRESSRRSTIILIADTDFLSNEFSVRVMNVFGMRALSPLNNNLAFFNNLIDSAAGNPDLISLRGKGSSSRPFAVVQELERRAQADFEEQLQLLEERMATVQARLRELQQQSADQRQLLANPQTQEAIQRFRLEEAEVRAQQREIRKRLREDIEALNLRLAVVNLLAAPLLLTAAGIVYSNLRKRGKSA